MLIYIVIGLIAFSLGELSKKIKISFGNKELKFADFKISVGLFLLSFLIPSFGLFTFSSGLLAHNAIRKRDFLN